MLSFFQRSPTLFSAGSQFSLKSEVAGPAWEATARTAVSRPVDRVFPSQLEGFAEFAAEFDIAPANFLPSPVL